MMAAGGAFAGWLLIKFETDIRPYFPGCLFHRFTGLHCAGCGMTRAVFATLHGEWGRAFRMNPMGMVLLPLAMIGLGIEILGWVRDRPLPFRFRLGPRGAWVLAGIVLLFWVLRNIPRWPFKMLAPY